MLLWLFISSDLGKGATKKKGVGQAKSARISAMPNLFSEYAKKFIFPRPAEPSFSNSTYYEFNGYDKEGGKNMSPLLHIPIVDQMTKKWTGSSTNAYLHAFPHASYLILYAHPNAVDIGMITEDLYSLGFSANMHVLAFEYTGYGLTTQKVPNEDSMYADGFSAYWFARSVLHVPCNRIILIGRSIGTAVMAHVATHLPSYEEERRLDVQHARSISRRSVDPVVRNSFDSSGSPTCACSPHVVDLPLDGSENAVDSSSYDTRTRKQNRPLHMTSTKVLSHSPTPRHSYRLCLVVLQSPFTSISSCVSALSGLTWTEKVVDFFGFNWFRTIDRIDRILVPVVFHHGTDDALVPFSHTRKLKAKRDSASRTLVSYIHAEEGRGHNNLTQQFLLRILSDRVDTTVSECPIEFPVMYKVHSSIYNRFFCYKRVKGGKLVYCSSQKEQKLSSSSSSSEEEEGETTETAVSSSDRHSIPTLAEVVNKWIERQTRLGEFFTRVPSLSLGRNRLFALLTLSVALFSMRCARLWQDYRHSRHSCVDKPRTQELPASTSSAENRAASASSTLLSRNPVGGRNTLSAPADVQESMESREAFIRGCMARWGSPLGVHIARFRHDPAHRLRYLVFGCTVTPGVEDPEMDFSSYLLNFAPSFDQTSELFSSSLSSAVSDSSDNGTALPGGATTAAATSSSPVQYFASVAELTCTPGLLSVMKRILSFSSYELSSTRRSNGVQERSTPYERNDVDKQKEEQLCRTGDKNRARRRATDTSLLSSLSTPNKLTMMNGHRYSHFTSSGIPCFIAEEEVSAIQTECERLVAYLSVEEWVFWEKLFDDIFSHSRKEKEEPLKPHHSANDSDGCKKKWMMREKRNASNEKDKIVLSTLDNDPLFARLSTPCKQYLKGIDDWFLQDHSIQKKRVLEHGIMNQAVAETSKAFAEMNTPLVLPSESTDARPFGATMEDMRDYMAQWQPIFRNNAEVHSIQGKMTTFGADNTTFPDYLSSAMNAPSTELHFRLALHVHWDFYLTKIRAIARNVVPRRNSTWEELQLFFQEQTLIYQVYHLWQLQQLSEVLRGDGYPDAVRSSGNQ